MSRGWGGLEAVLKAIDEMDVEAIARLRLGGKG